MTPEQIDNALEELSIRLERVRALYEQYFMGIERLEPTIPRKDVERRMFELRKTRFQNTAKRFKFQTIVQRYNSLQQYWYRTCRDIENGTYRKHVLKAERRFGKATSSRSTTTGPGENEEREQKQERTLSARQEAEDDLERLLDVSVDLDAEWEKVVNQAEAKKEPEKPAAHKTTTQQNKRLLSKLKQPQAERNHSPEQSRGLSAQKLSLPRLGDNKKAGATSGSPTRDAARQGPRMSPPPVVLRESSRPPPPPPENQALRSAQSIPKASPAPQVALPRENPVPPPKKPATPQVSRTPTHTSASPAPPRPRARMGTQPGVAASPRPATGSAQLTPDRIKTLHQQYVDARRQTNAKSVSYEKLEKSIRETEQKLRARHAGRQVDFDVSIKDGKAILKPKLK